MRASHGNRRRLSESESAFGVRVMSLRLGPGGHSAAAAAAAWLQVIQVTPHPGPGRQSGARARRAGRRPPPPRGGRGPLTFRRCHGHHDRTPVQVPSVTRAAGRPGHRDGRPGRRGCAAVRGRVIHDSTNLKAAAPGPTTPPSRTQRPGQHKLEISCQCGRDELRDSDAARAAPATQDLGI